jgi:hypothetical protein
MVGFKAVRSWGHGYEISKAGSKSPIQPTCKSLYVMIPGHIEQRRKSFLIAILCWVQQTCWLVQMTLDFKVFKT